MNKIHWGNKQVNSNESLILLVMTAGGGREVVQSWTADLSLASHDERR